MEISMAKLIALIKALGGGGGGGAVDDVQINGTSIVSEGVANIPKAGDNILGVIKTSAGNGVQVTSDGVVYAEKAAVGDIKSGAPTKVVIVPANQHQAAFYGMAVAAGDTTQSASANAVGTYTVNAKDAIMAMLGVFDLIAPHEGTQAANAYSIGQCFIFAGKLCKATAAIAVGDAIVVGTNCQQTTLMAEINA